MKSLEQDALRAQMILSKSQDGWSHATPSPSPGRPWPPDQHLPRTSVPRFCWGTEMLELSPSPGLQEEDGEVALVLLGRSSLDTVGPEDGALCSSRCPLRPDSEAWAL